MGKKFYTSIHVFHLAVKLRRACRRTMTEAAHNGQCESGRGVISLPIAISQWKTFTVCRERGIPILVEAERLRPCLNRLLELADYVVTSAHFPEAAPCPFLFPCVNTLAV